MLALPTPRALVPAFVAALVVAACSTGGDSVATDSVTSTTTTASGSETPSTVVDDETPAPPLDETLVLDRGAGAPTVANRVPAAAPAAPVGRIGFTRYVYVRAAGEVIPSLVEGPVGAQTRCQEVALPCSAGDLRALAASGDTPPAALGMSAAEVRDLVAELDEVAAEIDRYPDPAAACAAGFRPDRTQTPNMGSHFVSMDRVLDGEFAPGRPEIIMFARPDGEPPDGPLGSCRDDGSWDGVAAEPVGVAYFLPFAFAGDDHVEGFTGPLDNWHVHYNLCRLDGRDITVPPSICATRDGTVGEFEPGQLESGRGPIGEASEGWMIHAWADPDHDAQLGVFSMWNPSVWPVTDPASLDAGALETRRGGGTEVIDDFTLPDVLLDGPGTVNFFNADGVAHTVTAGTPEAPGTDGGFDTGVLGSRGVGTIAVEGDGEIPYFCTLHPDMRGTIRVG